MLCNDGTNPLNAELIPIYHLLALLRAHPILHISRIRVNTINSWQHTGMASLKKKREREIVTQFTYCNCIYS